MEKLEGLPVAPFMDRDKVRYFFWCNSRSFDLFIDLCPLFICLPVCLIVCLPFQLFPLVCMSLCILILLNKSWKACIGAYDVISRNHSNWPCVFCPSQVTKPSAQIGFIRFVLIPLFEALEQLFPVLEVLNTHIFKFFSTAIQLPTKSVSI